MFFQGVTTCHDETVQRTCMTLDACHAFREQFVTYARHMARHGTTWRKLSQYAPLAIVSEAHSKKMSARKSTRYAER